jgi:hypothetical protein
MDHTCGASPEVGEVGFQIWVRLIEGVEVENLVIIGLAESDRESPVYAVMIVKEEDLIGAVELL